MIVASHCKLHNQIRAKASAEGPEEAEELLSDGNEDETNNQDAPKTETELDTEARARGLLKCPTCAEDTPDLEGLRMHMFRKHRRESAHIFCCGSKHLLRQNAEAHLRFHLGYHCKECNITLRNKHRLECHNQSVHGIKRKFGCQICAKNFSKKWALDQHLMIHEPKDKRPIKCKYCDSRFNTRVAQKRHIGRIHEVEQREVCDICGKVYSCRSSLYEHKRYHTQNAKNESTTIGPNRRKDHIQNCFVCGMKAANMEDHMQRKHNRTTDLTLEESIIIKCSKCDMAMRRADMRLHSLTHGTGQYCNICCIRFGSGSQYHAHLKNCSSATAMII